jgi:hypothetical protein
MELRPRTIALALLALVACRESKHHPISTSDGGVDGGLNDGGGPSPLPLAAQLEALLSGGDTDLDGDGTPEATTTVDGTTITQRWHGTTRDRMVVTITDEFNQQIIGDLNEDGATDYISIRSGNADSFTTVETQDTDFDGVEDQKLTVTRTPGMVTIHDETLQNGQFVVVADTTRPSIEEDCVSNTLPREAPCNPSPPPAFTLFHGSLEPIGTFSERKGTFVHGPNASDPFACTREQADLIKSLYPTAGAKIVKVLKTLREKDAPDVSTELARSYVEIGCGQVCPNTYALTDSSFESSHILSIEVNMDLVYAQANGEHGAATGWSDPQLAVAMTEVLAHEIVHFGPENVHRDDMQVPRRFDWITSCGRRVNTCGSALCSIPFCAPGDINYRDTSRDCAMCANTYPEKLSCGNGGKYLVAHPSSECFLAPGVPPGFTCGNNPPTACSCCLMTEFRMCDHLTAIKTADRKSKLDDFAYCCVDCPAMMVQSCGMNPAPLNQDNWTFYQSCLPQDKTCLY